MTESYLQKLVRERKERLKRIAEKSIKRNDKPPEKTLIEKEIDAIVFRKETVFDQIFREVCRFYKIPMIDLMSNKRTFKIALARHVVAFIATQHTKLTLGQIAARLARDKSTIIHAIQRMETLMETPQIAQDVQIIKQRIGLIDV